MEAANPSRQGCSAKTQISLMPWQRKPYAAASQAAFAVVAEAGLKPCSLIHRRALPSLPLTSTCTGAYAWTGAHGTHPPLADLCTTS